MNFLSNTSFLVRPSSAKISVSNYRMQGAMRGASTGAMIGGLLGALGKK